MLLEVQLQALLELLCSNQINNPSVLTHKQSSHNHPLIPLPRSACTMLTTVEPLQYEIASNTYAQPHIPLETKRRDKKKEEEDIRTHKPSDQNTSSPTFTRECMCKCTYLLDFLGVLDGHNDRVRRLQSIQTLHDKERSAKVNRMN